MNPDFRKSKKKNFINFIKRSISIFNKCHSNNREVPFINVYRNFTRLYFTRIIK